MRFFPCCIAEAARLFVFAARSRVITANHSDFSHVRGKLRPRNSMPKLLFKIKLKLK